MHNAQLSKYAVAIAPAAIVDDATATATVVDARGARYVEIVVQLGATDIAMTALKVQSSDASGGTYADVTGATFDGGTASDGTTLALPSGTDDGQTCVFQIKMDKVNPFLKVIATFGNGSTGGFVAAIARLSELVTTETTSTSIANGGVCRV